MERRQLLKRGVDGRLASRAPLRLLALVAVVAASVAIAACGSSKPTSTKTTTTSTTASAAQRAVQAAMAIPSAPVPSTAISKIASLKGKTIYYVPLSSDVPAFAITAAAMKTALATVGVTLDVCSGNFNPSQMTGCFAQAIGAHAAAIVSDAIPYQLTASLITKASKAGIAVVITDVTPEPGRPEGKDIAYISGSNTQYGVTQNWIASDSGGKADVLELEATDSPTSAAGTSQFAIPALKQACPACKYTLLKFTSSNEQQLPSLVSSALLKNPNINYISAEYDQYVSFVTQGVQQANDSSKVKVVAAAAALSGLKAVADPTSPVKAEVADNQVYNGWIDADQAMRVATGQAPFAYQIPIRLFTAQNIGSVQLTNAAQADGEWFGPSSYQAAFKKLWGAS